MWILNVLIFVFILGIIVFVHELGHFIFAKRAGVHVYAFSIGMGPTIHKFKRKNDETEYFIKALPIGGYVSIAGEEIDDDKKIPKSKKIQSKTFTERLLIMIAGASFNFILSILVLFLIAIIYGAKDPSPYVGKLIEGYNAYSSELKEGDKILEVGKYKTKSLDDLYMVLIDNEYIKDGINFIVENNEGELKTVFIIPTKNTESEKESYVFGFEIIQKDKRGFIDVITYPFIEFKNSIVSMFKVISRLIVGKLGMDNLAGPIGIYSVVESSVDSGFESILSLVAFLGINVGFINLIPFPAFDGGRVLFLIIEKVRRKPIPIKIENTVNMIGFSLLMILMAIITFSDIGKLLGR
ncbi:MAG: M50 family metallopeptidase [Bacilli bacterium]|nr:M50 family metallopeptidase [Bacilli bacterium]